jgi:hypothetical protein
MYDIYDVNTYHPTEGTCLKFVPGIAGIELLWTSSYSIDSKEV